MGSQVHFKKVSAQDVGRIRGRADLASDDLLRLVEQGHVDRATGYFLEKIAGRLAEISTILGSLEYHAEEVEDSDD